MRFIVSCHEISISLCVRSLASVQLHALASVGQRRLPCETECKLFGDIDTRGAQVIRAFVGEAAGLVFFAASSSFAMADCTGTLRNKMTDSYSFKVFTVGADGALTQVQSGEVAPGGSATYQLVASYGTQIFKIYQNGVEQFNAKSRGENLANCNFGRSGGWAPFCLGIPNDADITILPQRYNCSKSKASQ